MIPYVKFSTDSLPPETFISLPLMRPALSVPVCAADGELAALHWKLPFTRSRPRFLAAAERDSLPFDVKLLFAVSRPRLLSSDRRCGDVTRPVKAQGFG
jgi:hypothetical protein